jgi:anhydro-N-acetylmuramic acid kinase
MKNLYIGLMSGTSIDGIDAALVEISENRKAETIGTFFAPYSASRREQLQKIIRDECSLAEINAANVAIGIVHADAVLELLKKNRLKADKITAIGFHGQTIHHLPDMTTSLQRTVTATWQLGDAAILSEKTGIDVVSNFRARDMAAGGQGAPLVPFFDYHVLTDDKKNRIVLNIGGIANCTFLPAAAKPDDVIAFDTGPGNCLIDLAVAEISEGLSEFDLDGQRAAAGTIDQQSLELLMSDHYFKRRPPKSTGRELFNQDFLNKLYLPISGDDLVATLTAFTAKTIAQSIEKHWKGAGKPEEIIVSGGGAKNKTLLYLLGAELPEIAILSSSDFGIDPDFKEAIAFAYLTHQTIIGEPGNLPTATGAAREVILGSVTRF